MVTAPTMVALPSTAVLKLTALLIKGTLRLLGKEAGISCEGDCPGAEDFELDYL